MMEEKKDIDFIKWMCGKAEDYQIADDDGILCISEQQSLTFIEEFKEGFPVHYRDLLQQAIEGVNKESKNGYWIKQCAVTIFVMSNFVEVITIDLSCGIPIDQAKESALKYIYEQETL